MKYYGNEVWQNKTDNKDKLVFSIDLQQFDEIQDKLNKAQLNYFGFLAKGKKTVCAAINSADKDIFLSVVGNKSIDFRKSTVDNTDKLKNNKLGNVEYRYIPQKTYINANTDTILKLCQLLNERPEIKYSGVIRSKKKSTITVSKADEQIVNDLLNDIQTARKEATENSSIQNIPQEKTANTELSELIALKEKEVEKYIAEKDYSSLAKSAAELDKLGKQQKQEKRFSQQLDEKNTEKLPENSEEIKPELTEPAPTITDKPTVNELSAGDVILYEGKRREIESITPDSIKMRDLDAPDFGGVPLSTSDVLSYKGWQEDMNSNGFEIISKAENSLSVKDKDKPETDKQITYEKEEEKISERTADDTKIGDRYLLSDGWDNKELTVTSMRGIYPDDVGVNAFLSLIEGEYNDIIHDRTVEDLKYVIPDLNDENSQTKLENEIDKPLFSDEQALDSIEKLEKETETEIPTVSQFKNETGKQISLFDSPTQKIKKKSSDKSELSQEAQAEKSENFTITDDNLGEGGAKTKFRNNVEALKTLKTVEAEKRQATSEEKETMSKYVGWGSLSQAFDLENSKWKQEAMELKELLTDEEYIQARSTVNYSFFTSPTVIDGIYSALEKFDFKGGNVLEPSMGVGNFFGKMPEEMQKNSHLYGVEIDGLTGRIAKQLYPEADIKIEGFQENCYQNNSFDVAVGNVPFGELGFTDNMHGTKKLHDYFFAETLDKVKPGGIVAFVTSSGTLDKKNDTIRKQLSERADLIGAIRLPGGKDGAFKENAGTQVTSDIIFLQKKAENSEPMQESPEWVHIGETADGLPINKYFADNPEMVLGKVVEGNQLYGRGTMVVAEEGADLKEQIKNAVNNLSATISDEKCNDVYAKTEDGHNVEIPSKLRNYSLFEDNDTIYIKYSNSSCDKRCDSKNAQFNRFKAFIELRDITRDLLEAQELDKSDDVIKNLQAKLNNLYDSFYKNYGLIHSKKNKSYFSKDVSYNLVASLEKSFKKDKLLEKSDIFTKRTIQPPKAIEYVETAEEALTLSVAEKACVDFEYMSKLTGMDEKQLKKELSGQIFKVPNTENTYQTASEYLSGDIYKKLQSAEEAAVYDSELNINVSALKKVIPEPLKAGDIDVKLGATWIEPKYYNQFMYELLQTPYSMQDGKAISRFYKKSIISCEYDDNANLWLINQKKNDRSVLSTQKFGTNKMTAYEIMEQLLNLKDPKIYKTIEEYDDTGEIKKKRVVDIEATRVVQKKAELINKEFKKWIFKDAERREELVNKYNKLFNCIRPREYDGSHLSFPLMNSEIKLHPHQKNAIAHAMFGGNTLFAHSVGAGKTYEMIATAMESKRLGLCTKSLFAVPNHLTEQIGADFQKLYPSANILVATKKDFQKENRQELFSKIATGNFDAVIIGHSQLGMIPMSKERQENLLNTQINDILEGISLLKKNEGSKFQIKNLERQRKSLQKQLDNLEKRHDDTLTFEQMGIDKLFVDEAHEFKNLFTPTKINNVSGISNSSSQKAQDLFMKCRYLDEKTGGKGVTFATGTPDVTLQQCTFNVFLPYFYTENLMSIPVSSDM